MAAETDQEIVRVAQRDGVLHVTMDRPPANALGAPLIEALHRAFDVLEASRARALVISSAVPGFFAAGADIKQMSSLTIEEFAKYRDELRSPLERLARCEVASIAAIDGLALGGGLELAMACSMRFATPHSRVGLPEVKLGLIPGAGGTQRLPLLVGRGRALDIILSGREVEGAEAAAIGLVDRLVDGDVVAEALEFAQRLARMPGDAVTAILSCIDAALAVRDRGMEVEGDAVVRMFENEEARQALTAFLGKRSGS